MKPPRYLKSGEMVRGIEKDGELKNPVIDEP